jgi:polyhydroxyalkanoate synthesis repressor PhaR
MIRLIKRYESRKLYDTEESRYVSLEEIAGWVRQGQEVRVLDNATSGDVTSQTLTQIILDEGRRGTSSLPSELLHELVRLGERAVNSGVEQVQHGVDRLVQASIDRLGRARRCRACARGSSSWRRRWPRWTPRCWWDWPRRRTPRSPPAAFPWPPQPPQTAAVDDASGAGSPPRIHR